MEPTKKLPLFIVTGASCAGKSTVCEELFKYEKDYIVMESDILWNEYYNTQRDGYSIYRSLWMTLCANISQCGKPVVLCGCTTPDQFESRPERALFTDIHYLAVVCSDKALEIRMREGRGVADEGWIESSMDFNRWLKANACKTEPKIELLDTTVLTPFEAAKIADKWVAKIMKQYNQEGKGL